jgi:hypothetical protein
MKVRELIEKLMKCNPNFVVTIDNDFYDEVEDVVEDYKKGEVIILKK